MADNGAVNCLDLLGIIDESLKKSMDALSNDLEKYLAEAGEEEFKKLAEEKKAPKKDTCTAMQKFLNIQVVDGRGGGGGILEPFIAIFMGVGEIIGAFVPTFVSAKKGTAIKSKDSKGAKFATTQMKLVWTNYKKSHQLLTW